MPIGFRVVVCALLLMLCHALAACAFDANASPRSSSLEGSGIVDVRWNDNLCIVHVHLDGHGPYRFLLDTGASATFVTPACAQVAGLELVPGKLHIDAAGASSTRPVRQAVVSELRLGASRFRDAPVVVVEMDDAGGLDGVLGFPVFADVLWTLDGPGQRLVLEHGRLPRPNGADILALEKGRLAHECPRVRGHVGGQPAVFLIDSGFDGFAWMESSFPRRYGLAFEPDPEGEGTVSTEAGRREVVHGRLRERITIGSLTMVDVPVIAGRGATWLLGGAFLKDYVTTFDQASRVVRFRRTSN